MARKQNYPPLTPTQKKIVRWLREHARTAGEISVLLYGVDDGHGRKAVHSHIWILRRRLSGIANVFYRKGAYKITGVKVKK